jgi:DNA-3-methyladenine glycosylase II
VTEPAHPLDEAGLRAAIDRIAEVDPDVAWALPRVGYPASRVRAAGFPTLLRIMTSQQLSTKSAAAIWGRLETALGAAMTAEALLALSDDELRAIGLSRQKIAYGRGLAEACAARTLDLDGLRQLPEDEAIAAICALKGFGRWSAEIYLLFALGCADVFPLDDLGLQLGMKKLKRLEARPDRKALAALTEPWRPQRGAGAIFLWHVYGAATLEDA